MAAAPEVHRHLALSGHPLRAGRRPLLVARVLTHADATILRLILSLFLVPLCIGMDQWLQQVLTRLGGKPQEVIDLSPSEEGEETEKETPTARTSDPRDKSSGTDRSIYFPLIRKTFRIVLLVFLFVVVGISILASLGVNIAPLLAGAGVVGLAIGFGSQTLVKDIISGVFFLIDDALRVGDYVEAGTAKGTVEAISLRSLRLRHPRGQLFIVPFGDLKLASPQFLCARQGQNFENINKQNQKLTAKNEENQPLGISAERPSRRFRTENPRVRCSIHRLATIGLPTKFRDLAHKA
jgi:hypothetical protein